MATSIVHASSRNRLFQFFYCLPCQINHNYFCPKTFFDWLLAVIDRDLLHLSSGDLNISNSAAMELSPTLIHSGQNIAMILL